MSKRLLNTFFLVAMLLALPILSACSPGDQLLDNPQMALQKFAESYSRFTTFYYLHPNEQHLMKVLRFEVHFGFFGDNSSRLAQEHFYATVIHNSKNKAPLRARVKEMHQTYSEDSKKAEIFSGILSQSKNFKSPPATSSSNFDLLWAEFFATGDAAPVQKIAHYLKRNCTSPRTTAYLGAAEWSLASNAVQHQRVLDILTNLEENSSGIMKKRLQFILQDPQQAAQTLSTQNNQSLQDLKQALFCTK